MKKCVINISVGGFMLSNEVKERYRKSKGIDKNKHIDEYKIDRCNKDLIKIIIIEDIGTENSGRMYAELKIIKIPKDTEVMHVMFIM